VFSAWLMDWGFPFSRVSLSCEKNFEGFETDNPSSFFHDSVIGFSIIIMSDYSNDETCKICGKRGDLICCDKCPASYHFSVSF